MNKNEQSLYYFALGEFVAQVMLQGIIHPDMQRCNIGYNNGTFQFVDFANIHKISMPEELTDITFHQLTEALFSILDDIPDDFMTRSYFRAGFTSYGGVLTHAIFSNAVNSGFSSFLYSIGNPIDVATYDASSTYSNKSATTAINEWKSCSLDKVTLKNYASLAAYNESPERKNLSHFNMYYLDKLYFVRSYLCLSHTKGAEAQLPILFLNMAVSAHHFGLPYTAYGLYQKCLSMKSDITEVNATCHKGLKELKGVLDSTPGIAAYIGCCVDYDLFELSWILNDLDYSLPRGVDLQIEIPTEDNEPTIMPNMAPVIMGADGVAPDLANLLNGDIYMVERVLLEDEPVDEIFGTYLERVVEFYSKVKTLLYAEAPRNFGDFYVPNEVIAKTTTYSNKNPDRFKGEIISNVLEAICNPHRDIVIRGTGGIGKSMMMRYLLLHFAENYEQRKLLPVLAPLKNYTENEIDLESFIFRSVREFDRDLNFDDFELVLKRGECLILLDGLDEIPTAARRIFEKQLISFRKAYNNNCTVVSSRPTTSFIQFGPFRVLEIQPFSKEKALELIDKLDYHDAEAKAKFRMDLDRRLYNSHKQFASNPLLLTIMLMTYTSYGDVPAKQHLFYAKAYETMARLHDASKGAYVRPMHTNLSPEEFAVYFAEFSARTYKAEILEFDERVFTEHMVKTIKHQGKKIDATPRDFLLDLTDNLCIMYKEGEKYYYIHRSFQEYFSAVFFANQMDDQLERIGMFFEERRWRMSGDKTFWMLWDMIQTRVDKFIFLPYLKRLWTECDDNNGYWTFLEKAYPIVYAYEGEPGESCENEPELYLYTIISSEATRNHGDELGNLDWPGTIDFCNRKEWTTIEKPFFSEDGKRGVRYEAIELDRIDEDYIDMNGEPELEGVSWEIHISDLMKRRDFFQDLIEFMEDDSFPLMKEYKEMREFTDWLDKKINSKPSSDDWFDAF